MHLCMGTTPTVQQTMTFDRVEPDEVNRAVEVRRSASGKPVNVARVLHTFEESVTVCVPLGGDTGQFIRADLAAAGVNQDCVESPHATRTCVTMIDRTAGTATELVEEHAPVPAAVAAELLGKLKAHWPRCRSVVLSGKLAAGAGDDFYADCCRAVGNGIPIILDTQGEALLRALPLHPLVVKSNRRELSKTLGIEIGDEPTLRWAIGEIVGRGAKWVVITMGRDGAVASDGKSFWKVPAIEVKAISAIGSGDAFSAGLASGVAAGRAVPEACQLAAACAAANTLVPGAGILRLEDVRRLEHVARVEKW